MDASAGNGSVQFSSLFSPDEVLCRPEVADRDGLLLLLLKRLAYRRGIGNVDEAYQAVLEREREGGTVIAPGLAVPHARLDAVDELVVAIATLPEGLRYEDGTDPVRLVILVLAPKAAPGAYLQALSSLAKICQDPDTAERVSRFSTPKEVWTFFDSGGVVLPDHLLAKDIMDPVKVRLNEHDTLEHAIDLFVHHDLNDLPVVDKEENLMGVVSTRELLRVGLPDYILWMEDLEPILNFEPFAEIMRKEGKTWLTEIMTDEYATVRDSAPAIQVAKEITRRGTDRAYVVRGERLVGVVSLQSFLFKVMRE
jgi:nitrogen PTS system EIIA component